LHQNLKSGSSLLILMANSLALFSRLSGAKCAKGLSILDDIKSHTANVGRLVEYSLASGVASRAWASPSHRPRSCRLGLMSERSNECYCTNLPSYKLRRCLAKQESEASSRYSPIYDRRGTGCMKMRDPILTFKKTSVREKQAHTAWICLNMQT
jgi:hypothetical protein